MRLSNKTKISLITFFAILLTVNMLFFIVLRTDAYSLYRDALIGMVAFLGWLGIATTVDGLEASILLIGFLTSILAASALLYFGLQVFRAQEVIQATVMKRAKDVVDQDQPTNSEEHANVAI
jgi:hypothetical protein